MVRQISATGADEKKSTAALKRKITATLQSAGSEITALSPIRELAELWYADKREEGLAPNTVERHRQILDTYILKAIGGLPVREATTGKLDRLVKEVSRRNGPGTAKLVKSVLAGMMGLATRYDALEHNPVDNVQTPKQPRPNVRALSPEQYAELRAIAVEKLRPATREERRARAGDDGRRMGGANRSGTLLDVMDFLIATGVRPAEALALTWEKVTLDAEVPFVQIDSTVVRLRGQGLIIQPRTKTGDTRLLALPEHAISMLNRRRPALIEGSRLVFTSVRGTLIDPATMRKIWRDVFRETEYSWVTQKTLRKTVATALSWAQNPGFAATQLGHTSDAMTRRFYIERSRLPHDARMVLDAFADPTLLIGSD
ncbi:tyrosine-type recombinase/integrase [Arthrobacter methylotrophus]